MTDAAAVPQPALIHPADSDPSWWRDAVIYQVYPRSWADSDGDGIGDLPGITARLPYLRDLGVDAVWLSPFYVSPMHDAGYDVADYRRIDPLFGDLDDADALLARAHELGLKVLIDLVPNHSSSEHAWFQAALAAEPGSPERDRYVFRDGRGEHGELPPNNWRSVFGRGGWHRVTADEGVPGQWYLHIFDTTQPDYNWQNPQVRAEFLDILRFWLDRGVDGFRVDVAHSLVKAEGLPDQPETAVDGLPGDAGPMWDQEGVHEIYRTWRAVLDDYPGDDRILCAEAWVRPEERLARYVRPDEMHTAFNFEFLDTTWSAEPLRRVIEHSYRANDAVGAPTTWVLSNHDVVRHASRLGLPDLEQRPNGVSAEDPQPDAVVGLRRARAASAMMLGLPGSAYLYQGEELGLPDHTTMPHEYRQDPSWLRTKGTPEQMIGRDGCRVPMPWTADGPSFGFGPSENTWLPQPGVYGELAVDRQLGVGGSTLELYRTLLRLRRDRGIGHGSYTPSPLSTGDLLAFEVTSVDGAHRTLVVTNVRGAEVPLPTGELLVASGPIADGILPTDTTAWLAL